MQTFLLLFCCAFVIYDVCIITAKANLYGYVDNIFGECPTSKNTSVKVKNLLIESPANETSKVSLSLHFGRKLSGYMRMKIVMKKCQSKESLNTCGTIFSMTVKPVCKAAESSSPLYAPIINCLHPRPKCPLQGVIRAVNCSYNLDSIKFIPIPTGYYTVHVQLLRGASSDEILGCGWGQGGIVRT